MANEYDVQKKGIAKLLDYLCLTPLGAIGYIFLLILPLIPPFNQDYLIRWFILAAIMGAGAMAFDFSSGYIAVVNFGFAAFVGLGAYTSAIVAIRWGIPLPVAMLFGAFSAGLLGFFTGAISLRTKGVYFIMITMAFSQMVYFIFLSLEEYGADDGAFAGQPRSHGTGQAKVHQLDCAVGGNDHIFRL